MPIARQTEPDPRERSESVEEPVAPALVWPHGPLEPEQESADGHASDAARDPSRRLWLLTKGEPPELRSSDSDTEPADEADAESADPLAAFVSEAELAQGPARPARKRWSHDRWLAVSFALVAIAEAALLMTGTRFAAGAAPSQGTLRVVTQEPGAEVLVDGERRGVAPVALALAGGPHRIDVRQGAQSRSFTAEVRSGADSTHHVDLASSAAPAGTSVPVAATASIDITSDPPGGRVTIDGKPHGAAPVQVAGLAPGPHEVRVADAGGTVTRQVRLAAGVSASLVIAMPKSSAAASGWVRIRLPVTAQIYEKDDLVGTTDVDRLMLAAGRHTLRLVNSSLNLSSVQVVTIAPGQTSVVNVPLPNGLLNVNALPWAEVWIDGQARGETPIGRLAVPIGVHEIVLRHPELGEQRRSITVTQGEVTRVGVDLRR